MAESNELVPLDPSEDHIDPRRTDLVRDPVHGYVVLPEALIPLSDHRFVQRLRRISQTSTASSQYPSLTGTRFEHSLGTMHLARIAWQEVWAKLTSLQRKQLTRDVFDDIQRSANALGTAPLDTHTLEWYADFANFKDDFFTEMSVAVGAAALLHDLGHTPYSHALEGFFERNLDRLLGGDGVLEQIATETVGSEPKFPFHELIGLRLFGLLDDAMGGVSKYVLDRILRGNDDNTWNQALRELISSEIDVDRIDYLMRDANRAGTEFGAIDHARLFQAMEMHPTESAKHTSLMGWVVGFGYRARSAIETFLTNRIRYYQLVLFHFHVVATNKFLEEAAEELLALESAAVESPRDLAIVDGFRKLRPNLNYIFPTNVSDTEVILGKAIATWRDNDATQLMSEVDDATIQHWLRSSASFSRAARAQRGSTALAPQMARLEALVQAVQFRTSNWLPLWKAEDHYAAAAVTMAPRLSRVVEDLKSELSTQLKRAQERGAAPKEISPLSRQIAELGLIMINLEERPSVGLNSIARTLLDRNDATGRRRCERRLTEYLAGSVQLTGTMKKGFWTASYQSTTAVRGRESGVNIYRFSQQVSIWDISSMVSFLPKIAETYPQLFVFFTQSEQDDFGKAGAKKRTETLLTQFTNVFPEFVENYLPDALKTSLTG